MKAVGEKLVLTPLNEQREVGGLLVRKENELESIKKATVFDVFKAFDTALKKGDVVYYREVLPVVQEEGQDYLIAYERQLLCAK